MPIKVIEVPKKYRIDELKGAELIVAIQEVEKYHKAFEGSEVQNIVRAIEYAVKNDILFNAAGTIYGHEPE